TVSPDGSRTFPPHGPAAIMRGLCFGPGERRSKPLSRPIMTSDPDPRFACDAMLGGLARWLRAAGYDSFWRAGIDDWDLVRLAQREGRVLLSSDTGIFRIGLVRDGDLPALWVPNRLTTKESQLAFVLEQLRLGPRPPRCMACGGTLV